MSPAFHGADPEQLDALARLFDESADRLNEIVGAVRSLSRQARWAGTDAERFHREVNAELGSAASRAAELVRAAGEDVRRNAVQQRDASLDAAGVTFGVAATASFMGAATAGRGIGDILAGGPPPAQNWHESPRVASLVEMCESSPPPAPGLCVGDLADGVVPDITLVMADALDVPSSWARHALGPA